MYEIFFLIIGLGVGCAVGFLLARHKTPVTINPVNEAEQKLAFENQSLAIHNQTMQTRMGELSNEVEQLKARNNELTASLGTEQGRIKQSIEVFNQQRQKIDEYEKLNQQLTVSESTFRQQLKDLEQKLADTKAETDQLQKKFMTEFENLANKILEEKTQKFTLQNKEQLGTLINPFQEKIKDFEKKVEENYQKGRDQQIALFEQIRNLTTLNQEMRTEAQNLSNALRGDKKQQGNWGELILEKVLERSGLQRGAEYDMQFNTTATDGTKIQPDVVVKLPDNKHIIIDAKVSLNAYTDWVNEPDEAAREILLKAHITNIRNHVKTLGDKNYHAAHAFNSPEFVLLFIPIESSFSTVIQFDNDIWNFAWDRKIVIVSPSTLLATLRTISSVWKQEKQNANALEIARQAGDMYDKFVGFLEDMARIETSIDQTQKAYSSAFNKLKDGNGNLVRRAENLKKLGAKSEKSIPAKFMDQIE